MLTFKVIAYSSINKANIGDIYQIDTLLVVVTAISKRKVYLDNVPFHKKELNKLKRDYIREYLNKKSVFNAIHPQRFSLN